MNLKQKIILRKLVEINGQRFSELLRNFSYEDKFPYHLKYLLTKELVKKRENKYYITKEGMKATSAFDTRTLQEVQYPIPLLLFICRFKNKYLVSEHFRDDKNEKRRLFALSSAKPLWGLSLEDSCKKEFYRKNGITADFIYRNTFHLINNTTDGDILFDNVFLVFEAEINENEFLKCKCRKDCWMTKEELSKLPNTAATVQKLIIEDVRDPYIQDAVILNYGLEEIDL